MLQPYVYEWVRDVGGSISAEHGLGQMKVRPKWIAERFFHWRVCVCITAQADYAGYSQSDSALALMRSLKATLDPNNILNPLKVLPRTRDGRETGDGVTSV